MKVQCPCGAKYEFDITPAMASRPVQFVCPACGTDASDFVDSLVRQQLGQEAKPPGEPVPVIGAAAAIPQPPRLSVAARAVPRESNASQPGMEAAVEGQPCLKHPGQVSSEKCYVCSKPICPKCMELFGYVCSPLCKAKAASHGIQIPVYAGQKSVREARSWRKIVWVSSTAGAIVALVLGFWFWYSWFGSIPKSIFSVRFPEVAYAGQSVLCGNGKTQLVFIHGNILARYDLSRNQEVWSVRVVDPKNFAAMADSQLKAMAEQNVKLADKGVEDLPRLPSADKLIEQMEESAESELILHVRGEKIWVSSPGKLIRYDWDTGKTAQEMAVPSAASSLIGRGDELVSVDTDSDKPVLTRFNLASCEARTEPLSGPETNSNIAANVGPGEGKSGRAEQLAGLPVGMPGKDMGRPMDPAKVAEQAQHLSMPARIALPATLANSMNQERTLAALNDQPRSVSSPGLQTPHELSRSLIPCKDGFIEMSVRLVASRIIERSAMKPAPGKSALDGNLTAGNSTDAASEMLNEMQRSRSGDVVQEDQSRYQVTLRPTGAEAAWTGEVIGPPRLFPLDTVNILAAGKMILVFDRSGKRLWQSSLNFELPGGAGESEEGAASYGQGPCVERNGSLYVFDRGVLTAFDLMTGNARWRLPSVGIAGLFFDDHGMIYVNTTTASPEKIKYSRQIDLSQKANVVVLKVDSKNGRILWNAEQVGLVNYISGKLVLTVQSFQPAEEDSSTPETGFETPPYLRIRRLHAGNGHEMWEHFQQRCPLDIGFEKNLIRLVFKKEVQVLKFLAF
jgi:hypothetical protein